MSVIIKVFGPPGTGKTRWLLEKFEQELLEVAPDRIAFLTFTRSARETALERSRKDPVDVPFIRTIHSICYRQLGITQGQLVRPADIRAFGRQLGVDLSGARPDPLTDDALGRSSPGDILLQLNHVGRHRQIKLREAMQRLDESLDFRYARWFTLAYRDWKTHEGLIDFTDLLTDYLAQGRALPIDVMFVDEAQDLSNLQWDVVERLGANARRWYIAGDDDQAIFSWAGADAARFIYHRADEELVLRQSHRLPRAVHNVAVTIAHRIERRREKVFEPRDAPGEVRVSAVLHPSLFVGRTFILYRNHVRGRELAQQLIDRAVPYAGISAPLSNDTTRLAVEGLNAGMSSRSLNGPQARAIIDCASPTWLVPQAPQLRKQKRESFEIDELMLRVPNELDWPLSMSRLPNREYVQACVESYGWGGTMRPQVDLMSVHKSKGLEASTVVLDVDMTRRTFDAWTDSPDDEHRVFYVGVTRARDRLITLTPTTDRSYTI